MSISLEHAYFLSMVLAALCYGIFVVLYIGIVYIIFVLRKSTQSKKSAPLFIVTVMVVVATVHLGVSYVRAKTALIDKTNEPGGALAYLNLTSTGSYMFQDSLYAFQTLMGDAFIVYRLYIVYARDKRILIPAGIVYLGSAVATIGSLVVEGLAKPGSSVFSSRAWLQSFMAFTLATNFTCTGLIAFKLWSVERRVYGLKDNRYLTKVAITVIESGALYSAFLISLLVTYVNNEWSLYVPFFLLVHVIGIAFSLIMIRVGLGISIGDTSTVSVSEVQDASKLGRVDPSRGDSFGMVRITRITEVRNCDCNTNSESVATIQKVSEVDFDRRSQSSISAVDLDDKRVKAV